MDLKEMLELDDKELLDMVINTHEINGWELPLNVIKGKNELNFIIDKNTNSIIDLVKHYESNYDVSLTIYQNNFKMKIKEYPFDLWSISVSDLIDTLEKYKSEGYGDNHVFISVDEEGNNFKPLPHSKSKYLVDIDNISNMDIYSNKVEKKFDGEEVLVLYPIG